MNRTSVIVASMLLATVPAALAQDFTEQQSAAASETNHGAFNYWTGDAGETLLTANITSTTNPLVGLSTIRGQLAAIQRPQTGGSTLRSLDADVYKIAITLPSQFSATVTTGGGDSVLALFDEQGRGVWFNDNRVDSATATGARLGNSGIPGLTEGVYYLGISRVDGGAATRRFSRPVDALGNLVFDGPIQGSADSPTGLALRRSEVGPLVSGSTLAGWELFSSTALPFSTAYTITLTGATYAIPTPGAFALAGVAGLLALRRRR